MVPAPYVSVDAIELTQQIHNQDSLTCNSHNDDDIPPNAVHSLNQCISSISDESYKKLEEGQMKPTVFMGIPNFGITNYPLEKNAPMVQHAYADRGLYSAYGSHPMIQPHLVPARVPLPLDHLSEEDGPIYVNAKQYHGILRRRQIRAKLEAQNKLVKNRKPYLHESRHKHALNRVRGSGGRFLPTNKTQQSNRLLSCSDSQPEHMMGFSWGNEGHNFGR